MCISTHFHCFFCFANLTLLKNLCLPVYPLTIVFLVFPLQLLSTDSCISICLGILFSDILIIPKPALFHYTYCHVLCIVFICLSSPLTSSTSILSKICLKIILLFHIQCIGIEISIFIVEGTNE